MAPQHLSLRIDAQVTLVKNVGGTLVNGSMGPVLRFVDPAVCGTDLDVDGFGDVAVIGAAGTVSAVGSAAKKNRPSAAGTCIRWLSFCCHMGEKTLFGHCRGLEGRAPKRGGAGI